MGRDEAEPVSSREGGNEGASSDEPLPVVGTFENLVDQPEHRRSLQILRVVQDRLEPFHLGIKEGETAVERVVYADAAADPHDRNGLGDVAHA